MWYCNLWGFCAANYYFVNHSLMIQRRTMHRCKQRCTIRCDQWRCYLGRYHCRSMLLSVFDVVGRCIVCGSMGLSMHRLCYCPWRYMRDRCYRCVVICRGDTTMHATMNLDAENELGTWCNKQWQAIRSLITATVDASFKATLHAPWHSCDQRGNCCHRRNCLPMCQLVQWAMLLCNWWWKMRGWMQ